MPFDSEITSVEHKLYSSLQSEAKTKVDKIRSYIAFWNPKRTIDTPFLKDILEHSIENKNLHIQYESKSGMRKNTSILSVYMLMMDYGTYLLTIMIRKNITVSRVIAFYQSYQLRKMKMIS